MSDEEDLLKLKKLFDAGTITADEYEQERAWILGTSSQLVPRDARKAGAEPQPSASDDECREQGDVVKAPETDVPGAENLTEESEPEAGVITVDQVMQSAASDNAPEEKSDEEKRAEDAEAAGLAVKEQPAADEPEETAPEVLTNKESSEPVQQEEIKKSSGIGLKILTLVCSLPILNVIGFILVLVKKPFSKAVNILLAVWNALWIIGTVAVLSIFLYTSYSAGMSGSAGKTGAEDTASAQTESAAGETGTDGAESYNSFLADLNSALQESYGDHYTITDNGRILTVSLWQEGVAKEAALAVEGQEGAEENWNSLSGVMQTLSVTLYKQANAENPERHVQLNVLNDENTDKLLLTYVDGTCVYDAVKAAKESSADTAAAENAEESSSIGTTVETEESSDQTAAGDTAADDTAAGDTAADDTAAGKTTDKK